MARVVGTVAASRNLVLKPLAVIVTAGFLWSSPAYAVDFGHSRLLSGNGQPLRIDVLIKDLGADDLRQLTVAPADSASWIEAGLTPPVPLSDLQLVLLPGTDDTTRIARLQSEQPFSGKVADVLIDVTTASGSLRHQVSLLAHPQGTPLQPPLVSGASSIASAASVTSLGLGSIQIRKGDTLFSLARRHAVPGVSVWQMMAALHNANPQAFINGNMNLLKAGSTLSMPDASALTALSNAQARALFQEHEQALASGRSMVQASAVSADGASSKTGTITRDGTSQSQQAVTQPQDQLKLSAAAAKGQATANSADDKLATLKNTQESGERIAQLEDNVRNLSQALQAQGPAAQEAAAQGARAIGQTLAGTANAIEGATDGTAQSGAGSNQSQVNAGAASGNNAGSEAAAAGGTAILPGSAARALAQAEAAGNATRTNMNETGSWLSNQLLAILTGLLALLVLIVAWLLRRANAKADEREAAGTGQITENMIQEKLDQINLDLQNSENTDANQKT